MDVSQEFLETCLVDIPEDMLARWYVDLNCWHWPRECPLPCPPDFVEEQTYVERHAASKALWDYIHAHTTAQARSRAWWLVALQRTEDEWAAFWALPVCARCGYRHHTGASCRKVSPWHHALRWPARMAHVLRQKMTGETECS